MKSTIEKKDTIMVIAPCYNEQENIDFFVKEWCSLLKLYNGTLCVINDGSTDLSSSKLQSLLLKHSNLIVLSYKNEGHGKACLKGFQYALKQNIDWVFQVDTDNEIPSSFFSLFWESRNKHLVIKGVRSNRYDFSRKLASFFYNKIIGFFFYKSLRDLNCPYRMISNCKLSEFIHNTKNFNHTFININLSLYYNDAFEVEISSWRRSKGESSFNLSFIFKNFLTLLKDLIRLKQK
jgi:hypothetical protein